MATLAAKLKSRWVFLRHTNLRAVFVGVDSWADSLRRSCTVCKAVFVAFKRFFAFKYLWYQCQNLFYNSFHNGCVSKLFLSCSFALENVVLQLLLLMPNSSETSSWLKPSMRCKVSEM